MTREITMDTGYIVVREGQYSTEFLQLTGGWSDEFPDAGLFTYREARKLACKHKADFGRSLDYHGGANHFTPYGTPISLNRDKVLRQGEQKE
jgi:hypothetical protein